jgi:hypothetical protein
MTDQIQVPACIEYEQKVLQSIVVAQQVLANVHLHAQNTAAFDAHKSDITLTVKDNIVNIEVKMNNKAQMGGTSISYSLDNKDQNFSIVSKNNNIDSSVQDIIIQAIKEKEKNIINLLHYWKKQEPIHYHDNVNGIACNVTKTAWNNAKQESLLSPIKTTIDLDCSFIHEHYAKKNCHYIQIGKSGFFYMKENPLNLPIPKLEGNLTGEIRLTRNGSKMNKSLNQKTATTAIRLQGRLNFNKISPYTLDNPSHIIELLK